MITPADLIDIDLMIRPDFDITDIVLMGQWEEYGTYLVDLVLP
jgi:hypothetical protein